MKTQDIHPHTIRWALVFVGLVVVTLILLIAGPAAQDQIAPEGQAAEDAAQEFVE